MTTTRIQYCAEFVEFTLQFHMQNDDLGDVFHIASER